MSLAVASQHHAGEPIVGSPELLDASTEAFGSRAQRERQTKNLTVPPDARLGAAELRLPFLEELRVREWKRRRKRRHWRWASGAQRDDCSAKRATPAAIGLSAAEHTRK